MTKCWYSYLERFSIECGKPKPKWSQRPIGVKEIIGGSQWQLEVNACNRPVARENASDQGAIGFSLHLIGWEGGASFLGQSNSTVKQNQFNPGLLSTLNWKLLYYVSKVRHIHYNSFCPAPRCNIEDGG